MISPGGAAYRIACDSLVALGNSTHDGNVLFAKNSDRPAFECQPLVQLPARRGGAGKPLRCTYIEIPDVSETARVIGSQPFWCWGFEHGLNEHAVAIGNHTVFTKDELSGLGLIGMDLVRLGLERGTSAQQALEEMTRLIEIHGQGGSGYHDKDWPYHNSFLVADRSCAYLLETSGTRWAVREVEDVASASNHLTIGDNWTALSEGVIEHAVERGWWESEGHERFDFARAYRDTSMVPEVISSGRHRRTCRLLEETRGDVSVESLKRSLRDHYELSAPGAGRTPMDPEYFSVCMHAEPVGTTTASMIARLPREPRESPLYFASLGSPCVGAFIPLFVNADIPAVLARGSADPSDDSPWWQLKQLLLQVEKDWGNHGAIVRAAMDRFENDAARAATEVAGAAAEAQAQLMQRTVADFLHLVGRLRRQLA
jgi:dipeptidase